MIGLWQKVMKVNQLGQHYSILIEIENPSNFLSIAKMKVLQLYWETSKLDAEVTNYL